MVRYGLRRILSRANNDLIDLRSFLLAARIHMLPELN